MRKPILLIVLALFTVEFGSYSYAYANGNKVPASNSATITSHGKISNNTTSSVSKTSGSRPAVGSKVPASSNNTPTNKAITSSAPSGFGGFGGFGGGGGGGGGGCLAPYHLKK